MELLLISIGILSYISLLITAFIVKHLSVLENGNPLFTPEQKTIDRQVIEYIQYINTSEIDESNKESRIVRKKITKDIKEEAIDLITHNINLRAENIIEPVCEVLNSMIRIGDELCLSEADNIIIIIGSGILFFVLQIKDNNSGKSIRLDLNQYKSNIIKDENQILFYTATFSTIIFIASFIYLFILE